MFYTGIEVPNWAVFLDPTVTTWISELDDLRYDRVAAAIDMLTTLGPSLGRPLVDTISMSSFANMKELRVGTCRILFAFDPKRQAILLYAGDKKGAWHDWYRQAIPIADHRFTRWLAQESGGQP